MTSVTIPNSVTKIGNYAFYGCIGLTSITIPNSVTEIGWGAFSGCSGLNTFYGKFASADNRCLIIDGVLNSFAPTGLTEYVIPDSVTKIGYCAFSGCSGLTSVTIPNSVTKIGDYAFEDCIGLTSITIGNSVTKIREEAFSGCSGVQTIICKATTPPILDTFAFMGIPSDVTIIIPEGCEEAYTNSVWGKVL